jgi:hypothetical protein
MLSYELNNKKKDHIYLINILIKLYKFCNKIKKLFFDFKNSK